ncbi:hypothetical protein D3C77_363610 [compost metagenome]
MPHITKHGLEVIDDPATRAHAVAGDDNRRPTGALEVIDHLLVLGMGINTDELAKTQWRPPLTPSLPGFSVPVLMQVSVGLGDAIRQGRIEDNRQL